MTKLVITSFSTATTSEGENLSYTYSKINEDGTKSVENERRTIIIMDDAIEESINSVKKFLKEKHKD